MSRRKRGSVPVHMHIMRCEINGDDDLEAYCIQWICGAKVTEETSCCTSIRNHIENCSKFTCCNQNRQQRKQISTRETIKERREITLTKLSCSHSIKCVKKA
jgi:hypothetical protein